MKDFFRKNAVIGAAEILGRIPLIFAAGYIARTLGPETYGNWALVIAFQGVLISLATLGLSSSIGRLAAVASPDRARGYLVLALRMSLLALVGATVLTVAAESPLAALIGLSEDLSWLLPVGCAFALGGIVETMLDAYFKSREMVARASLFVLIRSVIEMGTIIFVFGSKPLGLDGADLLGAYAVCSLTLKGLAYPVLVLHRAPPSAAAPADERRIFLRFGLPLIPAGLVYFLTAQGDRFILGHLFDSETLGIYAFGASVAAYMWYLGYAVNPLFLARASVLYDRGDRDGVADLFERSQRLYLVLFAVVMAGIVLFTPEIIDLTAGDAYAGSEWVLILLAGAIGLEGMLGMWEWVFHLVKRPDYVLWFNVIYLILNVGAVVAAALVGGPTLVAVGALGAVLIANAGRFLFVRRFMLLRVSRTMLAGYGAFIAFLGITTVARGLAMPARIGLQLAVIGIGGALIWTIIAARAEDASPAVA